MFRHSLSSGLAAFLVLAASTASAQAARPAGSHETVRVSSMAGTIQGIVVDGAGVVMPGATVLAMGTSFAADTSDAKGRFFLAVPAGDYVLNAALAGYVSAGRHVLRVRPRSTTESRITILRARVTASAPQPAAVAEPVPSDANRSGDGHGEIAWRLRQLPRTVLRDVSRDPMARPDRPAPLEAASLVDLLLSRSVRPTTAFFTGTDFTGQVNVLATASVSPAGGMPAASPRGVADVGIGAPVGTRGDWSVRAALGADAAPSWTILGEYRARSSRPHAIHVAVSYGTQGYVTGRALPARNLTLSSRSAGGVRASDRWRLGAGRLEIDYGGRFDRYDYLAEPDLLGGHLGARVRIARDFLLVARASREMLAPGADQFLPPSAPGPWLPPARTFSPLARNDGLIPEDVRTVTAGIERRFGVAGHGAARLEWFSQGVDNQLATLFGLDAASEIGHYYVTSPGSVRVTGWRARVSGDLHAHVRGSIALVSGRAVWTPAAGVWTLRREAPALARRGIDTVADVQSSIVVAVPRTSTNVAFDYRMGLADLGEDRASGRPIRAGRLNLELRQQLPYRPLHSADWNVLFTLRTLVHDRDGGSIYDELLTVRPPARMTGGLQVRF